MKNIENNKGITLITLVITIVVLLILTSIGTYSGIQVINSSKLTAFTTELKIMQTEVNQLYDKKSNGEKITINGEEINVEEIGIGISENNKVQLQANKVFTNNASGITEQANYRYLDEETIKSLNIEGITRTFFVNIDKRSVISYEGFKYEENTYYTLDQLESNSLYNVEHQISDEQPDFDLDYDFLENGKYKITISNINYSGNVNKWNVQFKKQDSDTWNQSKNYSFNVDTPGIYDIKIANNEYESNVKQLDIVNIYSKISPEVKALLDMRNSN